MYEPSASVIKKYADLLVNFALNSGEGVHKGEVVECYVPDVAKPLGLAMQTAILKAGGQPLIRLIPTGFDRPFFEIATDKQLQFFPEKYFKAKSELVDHQISVLANVDPRELALIAPKKLLLARDSKKKYRDWMFAKEGLGEFTWTVALWATEAKAKEVGMTLKEYWQEIIRGCYLDKADPIGEWRKIVTWQDEVKQKLNDLRIHWVKVEGEDIDLKIMLGEDRLWQGGGGRNIPSYELFTSPDWRGTEGWIKFNQPLYRYGNVIKDIRLEFDAGKIVSATAKTGQKLLREMIKSENADKLGEFSLTDCRISRVHKIMADTLFDENIGGKYGNTHVAIGMAYKDCYRGKQSDLSKKDWAARGFNDSAEHTDIVSTTNRKVTAYLAGGKSQVIYENGQFVV